MALTSNTTPMDAKLNPYRAAHIINPTRDVQRPKLILNAPHKKTVIEWTMSVLINVCFVRKPSTSLPPILNNVKFHTGISG